MKKIDWENIEKQLTSGKWVRVEDNIFLVNRTYYIAYSNGRQQRESTNVKFVSIKETNIGEARRILHQRQGQIADGKYHGLSHLRTTFLELVEDMLVYHQWEKTGDMERVELSTKHLMKFFCEMTPKEIEHMNNGHKHFGGDGHLLEYVREVRTQKLLKDIKANTIASTLIDRYIENRQKLNKANGTINRELSPLHQMFRLGYGRQPQKIIQVPPIPYLNEDDNIRKGFVEQDEYDAMKELLPKYFKGAYMLGYFSGMRLEEILLIEFSQVIWDERKITLKRIQTKTKEPRIFFVKNEELWEYILQQKEKRNTSYPNCKYLFFHDGEKIKSFRTDFDNALIAYKGAIQFACKSCDSEFHLAISAHRRRKKKSPCPHCDSTEIIRDDRLLHDLRRTGVRNLIKNKVSQKTAMLISGHKTDYIFRRYQIIDESDIEEACEKVEEGHSKQRAKKEELSKNYQKPPTLPQSMLDIIPANDELESFLELPSS